MKFVESVIACLPGTGFQQHEIGYELGFRDPSYFSRFFRRGAGIPPEAFRAEIREKHQQKHA